MTAFPTFAKIRAEHATRELRGVILPFERTVQQEAAAENPLAASWTELIGTMFDFWESICLDTLHMMQGPLTWDSMEIVEAEHTGRLLADLFEEA